MNINWKVRIRNRDFWVTIVPALVIAIQLFANIFGVSIDLGDVGNKVVAFIDALFVVLMTLGVVNDPTVATFSDSGQAMGYDLPRRG